MALDLGAIRARYQLARMAGENATDAGNGWDPAKIGALIRSWQDVSALYDDAIARADRPLVTVDPAVRFGQPAIKGISTDAIAGMVWAGESVETVADEYSLVRAEVLLACWYEAMWGAKRWRRRWAKWADHAYSAPLWRMPDCVADPPNKESDRCDACRGQP